MKSQLAATVDHSVLGELRRFRNMFDDLEECWRLTVSLPAFQPCYERWCDDGRERPDTRDDDTKAGRFPLRIPFQRADGPGNHEPPPPSDGQVAAVEYLKANQARVAEAAGAALVEQAPTRFGWDYIRESLSDAMLERLATPAGMLQIVELQGLELGVIDHDGMVRVGFVFHSEILEPEHGVVVVMLRDAPVVVGSWDDIDMLECEGGDEDDPRW